MYKKIAVIGLGYVGLPVALGFAKQGFEVTGFDVSSARIEELQNGKDVNLEYGEADLKFKNLTLTFDSKKLQNANFYIVTVPTPIDSKKVPDVSFLHSACQILGPNLKKGDIVVFESTVYPGLTEEECGPWLEKYSGLKCGIDFKLGYSPERINPSDKEHTLEKIVKVVSGMDADTLETVAELYGSIITAGVYKAPSIKVAEAAKVIENTQRDINIAFMNELAIIFHKMGIDTHEVLKAASTKWNFLNFTPGLVGGHCIGVDPYYLTHKALEYDYHSEVILAGRRINDYMGKYISFELLKMMNRRGKSIEKENVLILGVTFKENCTDMRNSKVFDIYNELRDFGCKVTVFDPVANPKDLNKYYPGSWKDTLLGQKFSNIIYAVPHIEFTKLNIVDLLEPNSIICDIRSKLDVKSLEKIGHKVWRL